MVDRPVSGHPSGSPVDPHLVTDMQRIHLVFMKTSRRLHGHSVSMELHSSEEYSAIVLKLQPPFFTHKGPGQPSRDLSV